MSPSELAVAGRSTVWTGEAMSSSILVSSGEAGVWWGLNGGARGFAPPLPLPLRL
jgi:hypothetical protein